MTKYQLKDQERQNAITSIFPWFKTALSKAYLREKFYGDKSLGKFLCVDNSETSYAEKCSLEFGPREYEEVKEYNPDDWNEWPEVKPPFGLMCVELVDQDDHKHYRVGYTCGGQWMRGEYGIGANDAKPLFSPTYPPKSLRFRPWKK